MNLFGIIIVITIAVLLGNLFRLLTCTITNWTTSTTKKEKTKHLMLFIVYVLITSIFCYAAIDAMYAMYAEL